MEEHRVNSWEEFARIAAGLDVGEVGDLTYAFRGQANTDWLLEPTLLRYFRQQSVDEKKALEIEQLALSEFRSQAHLHLSANEFSTTKDTVSWWTLMRHHGAPVRILDWTASIYVAAYFAVIEHMEVDGAIWVVHANTLSRQMAEEFEATKMPTRESGNKDMFLKPDAPPVLTFFTRRSKSERMIAQQSSFSISRSILSSHDEILANAFPENTGSILFLKIVIPSTLKVTFARKLRGMNILASSLFPGIDGIGRSIRELVQLRLG